MGKKTTKPQRNTLKPTTRLIPRASSRNCPVTIQVTASIWILRFPNSTNPRHTKHLDSPIPELDQSQTYKAIEQLQLYLEYYPQSERAPEAQRILFELQEKLALKELMATRLYFNLGTYMGNNYLSAVITAQNALKNYPFSKYREEFMFLIARSKYELALVSVDEKLQGRYRDVVDEYYNYTNEYPEGKYLKEVKKFYDYASKRITDTY